MGYTAAITVQQSPEKPQQPHKVRCAYTGRGVHYFIKENGHGPFCCRECQKRDDREGPGR